MEQRWKKKDEEEEEEQRHEGEIYQRKKKSGDNDDKKIQIIRQNPDGSSSDTPAEAPRIQSKGSALLIFTASEFKKW